MAKKKYHPLPVGFTIPVFKKLRLFAFKKNIPMSKVVVKAVEEYLKRNN